MHNLIKSYHMDIWKKDLYSLAFLNVLIIIILIVDERLESL